MRALRWLLFAWAIPIGCGQDGTPPQGTAPIPLTQALGGIPDSGFARAVDARIFSFPADHGPHREFRTEWWYFTGNLEDESGGAYGYQLTFFRQALTPDPAPRTSVWASRDLWFAHLAVGEEDGEFQAFERFERGAGGLAGAGGGPFSVWVGDWTATAISAASAFPVRLSAGRDGIALDLTVTPDRPIVLQGDGGLSAKGPEPGNASYYYSASRMTTTGTLAIDGQARPVTGTSWLDREWSTSALNDGLEGWDWFSIQLEDGRDLMLYRLRTLDGASDPFGSGVVIHPDGRTQRLSASEVQYEPGRQWRSPTTGASYPVGWNLAIPVLGIEMAVTPLLEASELRLAVRYWEGAIRVTGRDADGPIAGVGFLEMTGYGS